MSFKAKKPGIVAARLWLERGPGHPDTVAVLRFAKFIIGLLLLPVCLGAASAVWRILRASGGADTTWVPLVAGAVCWAVIYLLLPRHMWLYVAGHELTHALWAWIFGGEIRGMKVSSQGGHVIVSKTNFIIALAPYFFPFYAVLVVLAFLGLRLVTSWSRLEVWFLILLGAAYAFHVTLTGHVLRTRQSDITSHGVVFSGSVIFLGNALVLLLGLPLLTGGAEVPEALRWCWEDTTRVLRLLQPGQG